MYLIEKYDYKKVLRSTRSLRKVVHGQSQIYSDVLETFRVLFYSSGCTYSQGGAGIREKYTRSILDVN